MEERSFRIKRRYVYALLILAVLFFGYFMYSFGAKGNEPPAMPDPQATGMSSDMSSHHKPFQATPSGFFEGAVGKKAPEFELQGINGAIVKLSDYRGKNVVLFFNEGSMCYPACWNQISSLANDARFSKEDTVALSIVVDSLSQWRQILQKVPQMSKSTILFDTAREVSAAYDVLYADSSMHKGSYPGHTYFVIDKDGIIRYTKDDPAMAINNEDIASELEKIKGA
ncbi:TPA: redoxin domain-containing protein [Candidatus Woesearchaeota archaeon]|nr:redoxin domain-containing protein [Candidatus Woesearchaeota archaeon]HII65831.1 redoxin domain-containing protein [Candidatus Woesearchaeota archaeon]HIJ18551.1 redoxin domain-containing protein [Candidatus Woesearchaeota archaeon]